MWNIRRGEDRGKANHGWLDSRHTFSFADYYDPSHMGFRVLRVINEDRVSPGKGFGTHSHREMEIISYVLEGGLEHKDSMGTGSTIRPGEVQLMSAGTGVSHSEFNASKSDPVHFLQIWILPSARGTKPRYEQQAFSREERQGVLRPLVTPDGRDGSLTVLQDMSLLGACLGEGDVVTGTIREGRHAWLQVAKGRVRLGDHELSAGDGASSSTPGDVTCTGMGAGTEVLWFDLP